MQYHAIIQYLHLLVLFIVADHHPLVTKVITEGIGDFIIKKREQSVPGIDQIYLDVEIAKDGAYSQPITPAP